MRTLVLIGCTVALSGCYIDDFDTNDRYQQDFHYSYALKPGGSFSLENFNGSVEITGWDQNTVEINGTKYARTEQLRDEIKIDITHSDNSVSVRTIRPFDVHGNMGARYIVKVPKKVDLDRIVSTNGHVQVSDIEGVARLRSSNGTVKMNRLQGNLEATTTNGGIEIEGISGSANLRTSNGHVRAEAVKGALEAATTNGGITIHESEPSARSPFRLTTSNGPIDFTVDSPLKSDLHASTTNGSITVHMPASTAAKIRASTSNQSITSDFDVTMQGRIDKHHLDGTINGAPSDAPLVDLSTSNGHIRLIRM